LTGGGDVSGHGHGVSFVRRTYLQLGSADEGRGTRNAEKDAQVLLKSGPLPGAAG
jgi:hypothetical protein